MKNEKLYDLMQKSLDRIESRLTNIEKRLSDVEKSIAESQGKSSALITAKDIFVVLCGIAAVVISFVRMTQN